MAPSPRTTYCIFCDDVRQEVGNKMSFMGVYSEDLVISPPLPVLFPKFAVVVSLQFDIDDPPKLPPKVRVTLPGQEEIENIMVPPERRPARQGAKRQTLRMVLTFAGLTIKEPGYLDVEVETETGVIRAGRLAVKLIDASSPNAPVTAEVRAQKAKRRVPSGKRSAPKRR